jgi:hypothetical protein
LIFSDDQPRVQEASPREHIEAIRAAVLAEKNEKKKPPASEKGTKVREKSKKA